MDVCAVENLRIDVCSEIKVAAVAWKNGFFPYYGLLHAESCATEL